jgi:hypothetical protein
MGQNVSRTDFEWVYDDEPHKTRRMEILKVSSSRKYFFMKFINFIHKLQNRNIQKLSNCLAMIGDLSGT